ncbi:MAG: glycoside hydrolase family 127 protein [Pirellulaceae bacterium]|nr:glycoside hydrolase family 127 protein [Pirellulaceae bacterium]
MMTESLFRLLSSFLLLLAATPFVQPINVAAAEDAPSGANLALVATVSTSFVSGHETLAALNDGSSPAHSDDKSHGAYGNWPQSGMQWVQYEWSQPVRVNRMDVYWFDDQRGVRLPQACRIKSWNGSAFVAVPDAVGLGLARNRFNTTTFPELTTTKLRLEMDGVEKFSTGVLEWRVYDSGNSPNFAPSVNAGVDRVVVLTGQTYLDGAVKDDGKPQAAPGVSWSKDSGPGDVTFAEAGAAATTARFSAPGVYVLKLTARDGQTSASGAVTVTVDPAPPAAHLDAVPTTAYTITSPFWRARAKALIVNWIPHCVRKIEDPQTKEGGLENFVQAGRKLAGRPARHVGPVFANTWVYNTLESLCIAQQVDPAGDAELQQAQAAQRKTIEDWIPKLLSAQEPDGYLHTMYTIQGQRRWSNRHDHEGYQAGYFIEAAMAHWLMTGGQDLRMYDAAKRLADCWCRNIGPAPKQAWYEGHQELEQALVRFGRFVDQRDGAGRGRPYVELAKFLMDSRGGGEEYDQSHLPVTRQYEAVGHAVRAVYSYAGMTEIAMETGDVDYHSAVKSLWNSIVNRKYYVTGGVGSGETAEGFGKDYSLPNHAYCESCAGCGELFFQHNLQRAYQEARYADLYEETLYNAILGGVDLEGKNFCYTNALDASGARYPWHVCPCCVGNIPRTLLSLPTWMYTSGGDDLYVNLFVGSQVTVDGVAGTRVQLVQTTDYPWNGRVAITVNPAEEKPFNVRIRVPDRNVSQLYTASPASGGLIELAINGTPVTPVIEQGYAVLSRSWKAGDKIEFVLPLQVQRIKASDRIVATRGRVALRYGPLIYNLEGVDQDVESILRPDAELSTQWKGDLLGGVLVIQGVSAGGAPLTAIPNYARLNRGGRSIVWIKDR